MEFKEKPKKIGRLGKVHGIHGGIVVESYQALDEFESWPDWVFIYIDTGLVPFKLNSKDCFFKDDKHFVIFLDRIERPEHCEELIFKEIYFPEAHSESNANGASGFSELTGFSVEIEGKSQKGEFIELIDISGNPLLNIKWDKVELLIPAQEEFIVEIDMANRTIRLDVPEGLFDLN